MTNMNCIKIYSADNYFQFDAFVSCIMVSILPTWCIIEKLNDIFDKRN